MTYLLRLVALSWIAFSSLSFALVYFSINGVISQTPNSITSINIGDNFSWDFTADENSVSSSGPSFTYHTNPYLNSNFIISNVVDYNWQEGSSGSSINIWDDFSCDGCLPRDDIELTLLGGFFQEDLWYANINVRLHSGYGNDIYNGSSIVDLISMDLESFNHKELIINLSGWQGKIYGDVTSVYVGLSPSPVPLPAGIYLFLSGLVGLGLMRGRS